MARTRRRRIAEAGAGASSLATLIVVGIGLHTHAEDLAIGTADTTGALSLGAFLVDGSRCTTRPGGWRSSRRSLTRGRRSGLAALGLIAGAPAVLGAGMGALASNTSVAAFPFGAGAGAIAQVIAQLAPTLREDGERGLQPRVIGGLLGGLALMFLTGNVRERVMASGSSTRRSSEIGDYPKAIYSLHQPADGGAVRRTPPPSVAA